MCGSCPCDVSFRYSFFSPEFSIRRKIVAGTALAIGVALAIIFGLGIAGIIPGVNAQYPILGLTIGTIAFLGIGFALAGCKPRNQILELEETMGKLGDAVGTLGKNSNTEEDQGSGLNELAKERNNKPQQHLPDNADHIKVKSPSREILSQLPEWLSTHLLHIPHVIFKNRSFINYKDNFVAGPDLQKICSSPLTLFSTIQGGVGLCMKLHVEPETPILSTSTINSAFAIPETETFDIYVLIWKEKNSFVLRSETERYIHHRNSIMSSYLILGDRQFYCDANDDNIGQIIDIEKHDQLFGSNRHNLVWVLQRLFKKDFFKITTDTDGDRFNKIPNPDRGYWRISLVQG